MDARAWGAMLGLAIVACGDSEGTDGENGQTRALGERCSISGARCEPGAYCTANCQEAIGVCEALEPGFFECGGTPCAIETHYCLQPEEPGCGAGACRKLPPDCHFCACAMADAEIDGCNSESGDFIVSCRPNGGVLLECGGAGGN